MKIRNDKFIEWNKFIEDLLLTRKMRLKYKFIRLLED